VKKLPLLEAAGISKRFGGIRALDGMHFSAEAGEVHAILGENGAGKSTFIQILSGALLPDAGELRVAGQPYVPRGPRAALAAGIVPVFQEFSLIPDMSVAENIFFGAEPLTAVRTIPRRTLRLRTEALFADLGLAPIDPEATVAGLPVGAQQVVEIVKSLARDPKVLILDEATSALLPREVDWLLAMARRRAEAGGLVLYISHRMEEVRRIADRVTVLRNGETVGTESTARLSDEDIVEMMLGRRLDRLFPERRATARPEVALSVRNLSAGRTLRDASFELHAGEILGVAGLQGHGQRELMMALFGVERSRGQIEIKGRPVAIRGPRQALSPEIGMALLPEDRRSQGLLLAKPVRENVVLAALRRIAPRGIVDTGEERRLATDAVARLRIKVESIEQPAGTLSGGNQQKVVLAKLLSTEARILLFLDPTRGVDVGTKAEIFSLMRDLAGEGYAILFFSTDLPELVNVPDRTMVLRYGRVAAILSGAAMTEANILHATIAKEAVA